MISAKGDYAVAHHLARDGSLRYFLPVQNYKEIIIINLVSANESHAALSSRASIAAIGFPEFGTFGTQYLGHALMRY